MRRALACLIVTAAALPARAAAARRRAAGPAGGAAVAPALDARSSSGWTPSFDSPQWQALHALLALVAGQRELVARRSPRRDAGARAGDRRPGARPAPTSTPRPSRPDPAAERGEAPDAPREADAAARLRAGRRLAGRRRTTGRRSTASSARATRARSPRAVPTRMRRTACPPTRSPSLYVNGTALTETVAQAQAKTGTGPMPGLGRISWAAGCGHVRAAAASTLELRVKGDEIEATLRTRPSCPPRCRRGVSLFVDFKGLDAAPRRDRSARRRSRTSSAPSPRCSAGPARRRDRALRGTRARSTCGRLVDGPRVHARPARSPTRQGAASTLDQLATLAGAALEGCRSRSTSRACWRRSSTSAKTTLYYAVFDGKLVVTNAAERDPRARRRGARGSPTRRPGQDASETAGLPDETTGHPLRRRPAGRCRCCRRSLGRSSAPGRRTVAHLGTGILYGSVDGTVLSVKGFVAVR